MKTTNALQRIAAGMLTFSLVVMFAVLGFGLTKPIWAAGDPELLKVSFDGTERVFTSEDINTMKYYVMALEATEDKPVTIQLLNNVYCESSYFEFYGNSHTSCSYIILDLNGYVVSGDVGYQTCVYVGHDIAGESITMEIIDSNPNREHLYTLDHRAYSGYTVDFYTVDDGLDREADGVMSLRGGALNFRGIVSTLIGNNATCILKAATFWRLLRVRLTWKVKTTIL